MKKVNAVATTTSSQPVLTRNEQSEDADSNVPTFKWGDASGNKFSNDLNFIYDKIVYWKKNLFLLLSGSVGKSFIREMTRLVNSWVNDSPIKDVEL